jgi:hypothetical protein
MRSKVIRWAKAGLPAKRMAHIAPAWNPLFTSACARGSFGFGDELFEAVPILLALLPLPR